MRSTASRNPELEARIDEIIDMYPPAAAARRLSEHLVSSACSPAAAGPTCATVTNSTAAGHLIEAAVAYFHATGKRKLLDVMCRYVDHIDAIFGPSQAR